MTQNGIVIVSFVTFDAIFKFIRNLEVDHGLVQANLKQLDQVHGHPEPEYWIIIVVNVFSCLKLYANNNNIYTLEI